MAKRSYSRFEKLNALRIIELCGGNLSAASRELEIPRKTLAEWLNESRESGESDMANYSPLANGLTLKQARFADEYANSGNATDAARKAGYEGNDNVLAQRGHELVRNSRVLARVESRILSAQGLTSDEVKGTLVEQMRADLNDFVNEDGYFSLAQARANGVTGLLKRLDYDEFGGIRKFEVYSAQQAAKDLARILGMTQTRHTQVNQINVVYVNDWRNRERLPADTTSGPDVGDVTGEAV